MNEHLKTVFYKNTYTAKHNTYTWCGIVDKNGRMLETYLPSIMTEFSMHLDECTQAASDMLMDEDMYALGVNNYFHRFFKMVSPTLYMKELFPYQRERGRFNRENIYLYGNWFDAFYNIETFFKGVLWMFTTLRNLKNYYPFIDRCRIMRVNHDFQEIFGEDNLEFLNFDEIIKDKFQLFDTLESPESEQLKKISEAKRKKKIAQQWETWDNGMRVLKTDEREQHLKNEDLPEIYDYHFEIYKRISSPQDVEIEAIKKRKKFQTSRPGTGNAMSRSQINKILR